MPSCNPQKPHRIDMSPCCAPQPFRLPSLTSSTLRNQNFVVAGGSQNGTIAVITLPLSYVRGSPGRSTTLTLDAQNSSPKPGTTLTQWVWAVITIPDKRAVTNTTGRITQVRLRPGEWLGMAGASLVSEGCACLLCGMRCSLDKVNVRSTHPVPHLANSSLNHALPPAALPATTGQYQIGLLVLDSSGGNAVAQKNIQVGQPPDDPRKQPRPPIIPSIDGPLEAESGGELLLPAITDPNNDPVNVVWQIRKNGKLVTQGTGGNLLLNDVDPGTYEIQVKADDGMLTSSATYDLIVVPAGKGTKKPPPKATTPRPPSTDDGSSDSGSGSSSDRLDLDPRLSSLTLSQGATLEIDAGSTSIPIRDLRKYSYKWALKAKATGQTVTTEEGQSVSLPLNDADSLQLQLTVTDKASGLTATGNSNLKVLPRPEGADPLPVVSGRCGPFTASPSTATKLTCRGKIQTLTADGEPSNDPVVWAWRVTKLKDQSITTAVGPTADFGELEEGEYVVEAALGVKGPPTSTNTIYFLSSYLTVRAGASSSNGGGSSSGSGGSTGGTGSSKKASAPARAGSEDAAAEDVPTDADSAGGLLETEPGANAPNQTQKKKGAAKLTPEQQQFNQYWRQQLQKGKSKQEPSIVVELQANPYSGAGPDSGSDAGPDAGSDAGDAGWQRWQQGQVDDNPGRAVELVESPAAADDSSHQQQQHRQQQQQRTQLHAQQRSQQQQQQQVVAAGSDDVAEPPAPTPMTAHKAQHRPQRQQQQQQAAPQQTEALQEEAEVAAPAPRQHHQQQHQQQEEEQLLQEAQQEQDMEPAPAPAAAPRQQQQQQQHKVSHQQPHKALQQQQQQRKVVQAHKLPQQQQQQQQQAPAGRPTTISSKEWLAEQAQALQQQPKQPPKQKQGVKHGKQHQTASPVQQQHQQGDPDAEAEGADLQQSQEQQQPKQTKQVKHSKQHHPATPVHKQQQHQEDLVSEAEGADLQQSQEQQQPKQTKQVKHSKQQHQEDLVSEAEGADMQQSVEEQRKEQEQQLLQKRLARKRVDLSAQQQQLEQQPQPPQQEQEQQQRYDGDEDVPRAHQQQQQQQGQQQRQQQEQQVKESVPRMPKVVALQKVVTGPPLRPVTSSTPAHHSSSSSSSKAAARHSATGSKHPAVSSSSSSSGSSEQVQQERERGPLQPVMAMHPAVAAPPTRPIVTLHKVLTGPSLQPRMAKGSGSTAAAAADAAGSSGPALQPRYARTQTVEESQDA
jgi:hypothetical protein